MKQSTAKAITAGFLAAIVFGGGVAVGAGAITDWTYKRTGTTIENTIEDSADSAVIKPQDGNGVKVTATKISSEDYAEYGISQLAETAYTLTATITPSDATNKVVDYSVAWKNPSSSWASGKNVSDYVTVTQTEDGSLTATVECKQAFGEQIIITATVRDNSDLTADCTVDYLRKPLGANISIKYSPSDDDVESQSLADPITWNFSYETPNAIVEFPYARNIDDFDVNWFFCMCNRPGSGSGTSKYGSYSFTPVFSDTYTIDNSYSSLDQYQVAITQEYYDILKGLGFNMTCTPENYTYIREGGLSIGNLISQAWMSDNITYNDYVKIRFALKSQAGKPMFRIKYDFVATEAEDETDLTTQIYNVSFSSSSLTALAEGVSFADTNLVF